MAAPCIKREPYRLRIYRRNFLPTFAHQASFPPRQARNVLRLKDNIALLAADSLTSDAAR
jgi:hypothetical protein